MNGRPVGARYVFAAAAILLAQATVSSERLCGQPPTMLAVYADGSEARGLLTDIESLAGTKIGGQPLFAPGKTLRWLRTVAAHDAELTAERATARSIDGPHVELDNGDLLPGSVLTHRPEALAWTAVPGGAAPAHHPVARPAVLLVELTKGRAAGPQNATAAPAITVRVRRDRVRRIVWREDAPRRHRPRTLVTPDGSEIAFRSLRWQEAGVLVLLDGGETERYAFTELAALNLPPRDEPWDAWFDELAGSAPALDDPLVRVQTDQGLLLTSPVSRVSHVADGKLWSNSGFFLLRPSWSLDGFTVSDGHVVAMGCFLPTEVPLAPFPPTEVRQRPTFGGSWRWQAERCVQGGPLCVGGRLGGWGLGVQAPSEVVFPLCEAVAGFRGRVGLDQAVGGGGCARAAVYLDEPTGTPAWRSEPFVGTGPAADTGVIPLATGGNRRAIMLVADALHEGRPAAADPYDIRDAVDWIEPMLLLDPAAASRRIVGRLPETCPAWKGWTPVGEPAPAIRGRIVADPLPGEPAGFVTATVAEGGPLRLQRSWTVGPQERNLVIAVSRPEGTPEASVDVIADGIRWRLPLAPRPQGAAATAHALALDPERSGPMQVEIVVPAGATACWHALNVTGPLDGPDAIAGLAPVRLVRSAPAADEAGAGHLVGTPVGTSP